MSFASCEVGDRTEEELSACSRSDGPASFTTGKGGGEVAPKPGEGGLRGGRGATGGLQQR